MIKQTNLRFEYTNWRGDDHVYVIEPDGKVEFYEGQGMGEDHVPIGPGWTLSGYVVSRDDDPRPEMGNNRRRSFLIADMRAVVEVEVSA